MWVIYSIRQKIRKYRKALNMSQENLAEIANISITHMSHIETGNTKLSLPVLVDLATALNVRTDELLFDTPVEKDISVCEIKDTLDRCTPQEVKMISEIVKSLKFSFDKYL